MPEASLRDRRRDVEHAVVRVLASARTIDEAVPEILSGICLALDWDVGALWTVDRLTRRIGCRDVWSRNNLRFAGFLDDSRDRAFRCGEGLPGHTWETARPAWVKDIVVDENFPRVAVAEGCGLHSAFAFPIVAQGEVFGVIECFSTDLHAEDDELLDMLEGLGATIGLIVEREDLERQLAFQNAVLKSQSEASLDGIIVVDDDENILYANRRFAELWDLPQDMIDRGDHREVLRHKLLRLRDPEKIVDLTAQTTQREEIELVDGRVLDRWTAPLDDGGRRAWFYRDVTEQKRTEQRRRDNEEWLSFVAEATTAMSRSLDFTKELNDLARLAVPRLGDWCAIHVVDEASEMVPVAVGHADPDMVDATRYLQTRYPLDPGVVGVIRSGEPVLVERVDLDSMARDEEHLGWLRRLGCESMMIVPFRCRGRVLGSLTLVSSSADRRYTAAELKLVEDLATRVAFPIDNARLYEERARIAKTLQDNLLPPELPDIPGVELAAHYYPAATGVDVGGDFYDIFPIGARDWGVTVGDVSGKGVEAAAITALARHTLRTAAMTTRAPSSILRILNTALFDQTAVDRFCTAVYARVEPRFGRLRVTASCGGHPPPYIIRSDGSIETAQCAGTALGIVADPELRDTTVELGFGDKLVLYTDGLVDVRTDAGVFGPQQLEPVLRQCRSRGASATAKLIAETVVNVQHGEPGDDIALVVLGVRASIFRVGRRSLPE